MKQPTTLAARVRSTCLARVRHGMEPIEEKKGGTLKMPVQVYVARAVDFCGDVDVTWELYGVQNLQE